MMFRKKTHPKKNDEIQLNSMETETQPLDSLPPEIISLALTFLEEDEKALANFAQTSKKNRAILYNTNFPVYVDDPTGVLPRTIKIKKYSDHLQLNQMGLNLLRLQDNQTAIDATLVPRAMADTSYQFSKILAVIGVINFLAKGTSLSPYTSGMTILVAASSFGYFGLKQCQSRTNKRNMNKLTDEYKKLAYSRS